MRTRWVLLFDTAVLLGLGVYMTLILWRLPGELRHKLFTASLHVLAQLTGMTG